MDAPEHDQLEQPGMTRCQRDLLGHRLEGQREGQGDRVGDPEQQRDLGSGHRQRIRDKNGQQATPRKRRSVEQPGDNRRVDHQEGEQDQ